MKRGSITILLCALMLVIPVVSAADVPFSVKTAPFHDVTLTVYQQGTSQVSFQEKLRANSQGVAEFTVDPPSDKLRVIVFVQRSKEKVAFEEYTDVELDISGMEFEAYPLDFDPSSIEDESEENDNETIEFVPIEENTTEAAEEIPTEEITQAETQGTITGEVTDGTAVEESSLKEMSMIFVYIFGAVLLLAIVMFIGIKAMLQHKHKKDVPKQDIQQKQEIKVKKLSDLQEEKKLSTEEQIRRAEQQIKEAQEALNKLKNENKIKELEEKMKRDQEELEKLRSSHQDQ